MLFGLRGKAQFIHVVNDLSEIVAALNLVFYLPEDFADIVFDGVRPARLLLEAVQIGDELLIDEITEVVAGEPPVVVNLAVLVLGCRPGFPAVLLVQDVGIFLAVELGLHRLLVFQRIEVFQEQEP